MIKGNVSLNCNGFILPIKESVFTYCLYNKKLIFKMLPLCLFLFTLYTDQPLIQALATNKCNIIRECYEICKCPFGKSGLLAFSSHCTAGCFRQCWWVGDRQEPGLVFQEMRVPLLRLCLSASPPYPSPGRWKLGIFKFSLLHWVLDGGQQMRPHCPAVPTKGNRWRPWSQSVNSGNS